MFTTMLLRSRCLYLSLLLIGISGCASTDVVSKPLSATEVKLVEAEVIRMIQTDEREVEKFVVKDATPERIDRYLDMQEFLQHDSTFRGNTLILAGKGKQLSFDKPSDILHKMEKWFPAEIAADRAGRDPLIWGLLHSVNLYGPFRNWDPEPIVFFGFWRTFPSKAWVYPDQIPFTYERGAGRHLVSMGKMVRRAGMNMDVLFTQKFERYLSTYGCQGTGPDDCVLLMYFWADIDPKDKRLIALMQKLEPVIQLETPKSRPFEGDYNKHDAIGDEGMRKFAFLRAKLASVLSDPSLWPEASLEKTLHQISLVRQDYSDLFSRVNLWKHYNDHSGDSELNPMLLITDKALEDQKLNSAITAELGAIDKDHCDVYLQWVQEYSNENQQRIAATIIRNMTPARKCAQQYHGDGRND